jgi:hypothetical protein
LRSRTTIHVMMVYPFTTAQVTQRHQQDADEITVGGSKDRAPSAANGTLQMLLY